MADNLKGVTELGMSYVRAAAARQVPAVKEYGGVLQDYADGKIDGALFGEKLLSLGFREATRTAEDFLKFGIEFYSKLASGTGIKVGEALDQLREAPVTTRGSKAKRKS